MNFLDVSQPGQRAHEYNRKLENLLMESVVGQ